MRITFHLTPDDYYEASRASTPREMLFRRSAILLISFCLIVFWVRKRGLGGVYDCIVATIVLLPVRWAGTWFDRFYFKRALRKKTEKNSSREITFDVLEDGLHLVGTPDPEPWSHFSRYLESAGVFVLFHGKYIEAVLPKRAFNAQGVQDFRRILARKVTRS
jgi:hypothetical protein